MWLPLLTLLIVNSVSTIHASAKEDQTLHSSIGPTSTEEAGVLWKKGNQAFEEKKYPEAVRSLERLIHRYPASAHFFEAHRLLGIAHLENHEPHLAIVPLKDFVEVERKSSAGLQTRLALGRALLDLKKFHETLLLAEELLVEKGTSNEVSIAALLMKARALMGLNEDARATQSLDSAKVKLEAQKEPSLPLKPLKGQAAWLELKLKIRTCEKFPTKGSLTEEQIRNQLNRRGTCLSEASLLHLKTLEAGDLDWGRQSALELSSSFQDYTKACKNPSNPPPLARPEKRTKTQLKQYRSELVQLLQKECAEKREKAETLLLSKKEKSP